MIENFVTYDIALKLREIGYWRNDTMLKKQGDSLFLGGEYVTSKFLYEAEKYKETISKKNSRYTVYIPTWEEATHFLENKGYYIHMGPEFYKDGINWCWQILWYLPKEEWTEYNIINGTYYYGDNSEFSTRRIAVKAAIEKIIEIINK